MEGKNGRTLGIFGVLTFESGDAKNLLCWFGGVSPLGIDREGVECVFLAYICLACMFDKLHTGKPLTVALGNVHHMPKCIFYWKKTI